MYSYGDGKDYWKVHKKVDFNPYDEEIDGR